MKDNELIAEFMGYKFDGGMNHLSGGRRGHKYSYYTNDAGQSVLPNRDKTFDNWSAIIPVVQRINFIDMLQFDLTRETQFLQEQVITTRVTSEFKFLKKAIVNFIKWYNAQQK